jgi:hypothetical protein
MRRWLRCIPLLGVVSACTLVACGDDHGSGSVTPGRAGASGSGGGEVTSAGRGSAGSPSFGGMPSGGADAAGGGANPTGAGEDAPGVPLTFTASYGIILNPERGFFAEASLVDAPELSMLRTSGVTLVHGYVRLDDYRTSDLPAPLLTQITAGFEQVRKAASKSSYVSHTISGRIPTPSLTRPRAGCSHTSVS